MLLQHLSALTNHNNVLKKSISCAVLDVPWRTYMNQGLCSAQGLWKLLSSFQNFTNFAWNFELEIWEKKALDVMYFFCVCFIIAALGLGNEN